MAEKNGITRLERAQAAAWKAIRETQKSIRESREESQKAAQESREEIRQSREEMREFRESMRETLQKVSDNIDKLSEENREFRKSLKDASGRFDRKFGELWELMVVPNIKEKFNELGFHFESVARDFEFDRPNIKGRTLAEADIILENGDSAIVVEVKDCFKEKYLAEHLVRMKKLKTLPRFANKKLYGAIAAGFVKDEFKRQAFKHGFYVLNRPDTMNVEIEPFPKGCKPRAW